MSQSHGGGSEGRGACPVPVSGPFPRPSGTASPDLSGTFLRSGSFPLPHTGSANTGSRPQLPPRFLARVP